MENEHKEHRPPATQPVPVSPCINMGDLSCELEKRVEQMPVEEKEKMLKSVDFGDLKGEMGKGQGQGK